MKKRAKIAVTVLGLLFCAQAAVPADPKVPVLPGGGFVSVPVEKVVVPPANGKEKKAQPKKNGEKAKQKTKQVIVPVPSGKAKPALKLPPAPGPGRQAGKEKTAPPVVKLPPATLEKVVPPAALEKKPTPPAKPRVPVVAVPGGKGFTAPSAATDRQKGSSSGVIPRLPPVRLDKGLPPAGGRTASGKGKGNGSAFPVLPSTSLGKVLEQSGKTRKPDGKAPAPVIEGLKLPGKEILTGDKKVPGSKGQPPARGFPVAGGVPGGARTISMDRVVLEQGVIRHGDPGHIFIRIRNASSVRARMAEVRLWKQGSDDAAFPLVYSDLEPGTVREETVWIGRSPDGSGRVWRGLELAAGECLEGALSWYLADSGETRQEPIRICPDTTVLARGWEPDPETLRNMLRPAISRIAGEAMATLATGEACVSARRLKAGKSLRIEGNLVGTRPGRVEVLVGKDSDLVISRGTPGQVNILSWDSDGIVFTLSNANTHSWGPDPLDPSTRYMKMKVSVRDGEGNGLGVKIVPLCPVAKGLDIDVAVGADRLCEWPGISGLSLSVEGRAEDGGRWRRGLTGAEIRARAARVNERRLEERGGKLLEVRGISLSPGTERVTARFRMECNYGEPPIELTATAELSDSVERQLLRLRSWAEPGEVVTGSVQIDRLEWSFKGITVHVHARNPRELALRPFRIRLAEPHSHVRKRVPESGKVTIFWPKAGKQGDPRHFPKEGERYVIQLVGSGPDEPVLDQRTVEIPSLLWRVRIRSGRIQVIENGDHDIRARGTRMFFYLIDKEGILNRPGLVMRPKMYGNCLSDEVDVNDGDDVSEVDPGYGPFGTNRFICYIEYPYYNRRDFRIEFKVEDQDGYTEAPSPNDIWRLDIPVPDPSLLYIPPSPDTVTLEGRSGSVRFSRLFEFHKEEDGIELQGEFFISQELIWR